MKTEGTNRQKSIDPSRENSEGYGLLTLTKGVHYISSNSQNNLSLVFKNLGDSSDTTAENKIPVNFKKSWAT